MSNDFNNMWPSEPPHNPWEQAEPRRNAPPRGRGPWQRFRSWPLVAQVLVWAVVGFFGLGAVGAAAGAGDKPTSPSSSTTTTTTAEREEIAATTTEAPTTTAAPTTTTTAYVPPTTVYVPPTTVYRPPTTVRAYTPPTTQAVGSADCTDGGSYTNVDGNDVHSPCHSSTGGAPAGATAQCNDGTYSFSQHRSGTCSSHGGVAQWL